MRPNLAIFHVAALVAWSCLAASAGPLMVCCSADNDLFRVASKNGVRLKRVNTPQIAVERADEGGGVLLLADGYPSKTTDVDDTVFELASRKHLRLYVEFPSRVPGLDFGPVAYLKTGEYHAIVERTVVTTDAFGPDLPKDRILMIQDCHYLPTKAANPYLVLARVEGYDRLAYGLPAVTHPILFELPTGGVLVATTKLSQFVTGRYAPTEAWGPVWQTILSWLQPGKTVPTLKWTPTVRPSFTKSEPLPKDALKQAVRRGTHWYLKSRLFIHPDWPKETESGYNELPASASVGDGSYGFAEGFISKRTFYTGNQAISRTLRADCNLEAAMGLACGAKLFHDEDCRLRAQRLDDLICLHSHISQGPRAKPDSPSYGLLGGSEESNGSSGIYWGDDNARGILSCIAASALLETNRWNDQIVKTILGNFRTTGPYGFRPATLFEDSLHNQGWRYYWDLKNEFYCAHMESWPWATFLWLYGQTHFKPLLQRAENGIRMMMAAYPHWQLEANRYEQERARMLLPLAWLVRADDTPEHRAWLSTIAEYIISIQDASGAVPQRLGEMVRSNDGYGANECGIIHQDGDPATDLLYAMNFAFVGMVEAAAATGEPRYARSADRMTDFLIRCQTRSDRRPELDGTWYRGFDFAKWDYWASDGDAGWGVWTTESGWTHSWITATLALREMKTNLWSLTMNSDVRKPFAKFRPQMLPDDALAERAQVNLSGKWSFQADRLNEGESAGWFTNGEDLKSWREVTVPVAFDNCGPDLQRYAGVGWFRKNVRVPESFRGRRIGAHFEGINYNAKVWVNGKLVGENHDAFLPFTFPIDDAVKIGADNEITVRVDNLRARGQFPLFEGWFGQGGFLREACLMATSETCLMNTFVEAEPGAEGGHLRLRAAFTNGMDHAMPLQIQVRVLDAKGKELTTLRSITTSFAPGQAGELSVEGDVPGVQSWSPKSPALYTAYVTLMNGENPLDTLTRRVGFRRVEVKDAKILLNGAPLFLMGFDRHEDSPRTGMAVDLAQAREDFTAMKKMGCNFVRLCHYPHDQGELDLCDELGLLVLAENAMNEWGHYDHPDPDGGFKLTAKDAPLILENAKRTLSKMVQRDNHHPSIILWSVGNESAEERADVAEGNGELIQFGRTLDASRPWTHVSNSYQIKGWESLYRFDDVIAENIYPSHRIAHFYRTNLDAGLPEATKWMEDSLEKLHRQFPSKPIVVTEFGFPGGESGPNGAEIQAIASEAEFKGLCSAPYVAGCAYWAYARHPWHGLDSSGQGVISPYGYVSRDRKTRFPAFAVVERLYKEHAGLATGPGQIIK